MAKLDFNTVKRPTLELVMQDEAKTVIKVTTPKEALIEKLQATLPELQGTLANGDQEAIGLCYDLAARLINCNLNFVTVTVEELRGKYGLGLENLLLFYSAYLDFISELHDAKN